VKAARRIARTTHFPRLVGLVALAALALGAGARHAGAQISAADDPRPFVVKVHASWCGTCAALEPTWKRIEADYGDRARLVVFDVSDRKSVAASRALAEVLGLSAIFEKYKGSTGTIAVLRSDREPVAVLKGEMDLATYKRAIDEALVPSPS
jgi:thiol-disulfide isomerase/thioredoxin